MVGFSIVRRPVKISTCRFHETMRLLGPFDKFIFDLSYHDLEGSGQGHETKKLQKMAYCGQTVGRSIGVAIIKKCLE